MKFIIKLCFILSCLLINQSVRAQNDNVLAEIKYAEDVKDYLLAATLYEQLIYASEDDIVTNHLLLKKSRCYKQNLMYDQALNALNRMEVSYDSDVLDLELFYEKALLKHIIHDFKGANSELNNIDFYFPELAEKLNNQIIILKILNANALGEWERGSDYFKEYLSTNNVSFDSTYVYDFLAERNYFYNPTRLKRMSFLIPGYGQFATGEILEGLSSIVLQSIFILFTHKSFIKKQYISGLLTGTPVLFMFYMGGAEHAKFLAEEKNNLKRIKIQQNIKTIIGTIEEVK